MGPVSPVGPCWEKCVSHKPCSRDTQGSNLLFLTLRTAWPQRQRAIASPLDLHIPLKVISLRQRSRKVKANQVGDVQQPLPGPVVLCLLPNEVGQGLRFPGCHGETSAERGSGECARISWVSILFTATFGGNFLRSKVTAPCSVALSLQARPHVDLWVIRTAALGTGSRAGNQAA